MRIKHLDTNDQLRVKAHHSGLVLVKPNGSGTDYEADMSVSDLLSNPFNVYFVNTDSAAQKLNEQTLHACGWDSNKEVFGKSVIDVWGDNESLRAIILNDQEVMKERQMRISEEEVICADGISHHALSIKLPWYGSDTKNKVIGMLGCTLVTGMPGYASLPDFLATMINSGLLTNANSKQAVPGMLINGIYFSKREKEIIYYILHGKSAKRIAMHLGISYRTVERHFENIRNKAGVRNKSELIEKMFDYFSINININ